MVRPQIDDRSGSPQVKAGIFGASEVEAAGEGENDDKESHEFWESMMCEPCELDDDEAVGRPLKLPRDFRKPTKQEVLEHLPSHWVTSPDHPVDPPATPPHPSNPSTTL